MPDILNGSFETAGVTPGEAQSWTILTTTTSGVVATFTGAAGASVSLEQFDHGWGTVAWSAEPDGGDPALFDAGTASPTALEQFDNWNDGKPYQFDVNTGVSAQFTSDTPGQVVLLEQFDEGWNTDTWAAEPGTDAVFGDSFDTGWNTDTWAVEPSGGTDAMFDGGSNALESFENAWPDILFFVDPGTEQCTAPTMPSFGPPPNNFPVTIVTTGGYPGGLTENRTYYLRNVTPSGGGFTFNLSKTVGGSFFDITDAGEGSHYLHADPAQFWTRFEE